MKGQITWRDIAKFILLTAILFTLSIVDFVNFTVSVRTPGMLLLVAIIQVFVLSLVTLRSQQRDWRLVLGLFLSFYGVSSILVAIEAIYLPETLPQDIVVSILINGGIRALVYALISVKIWGYGMDDEPTANAPGHRETPPDWRWLTWVGKLMLIGLCWAILFVLGGALVFLPIAAALDAEALASYINLDMPGWVLPFQVVRGIAWALLTLPLIRMLRGPRWKKALAIGLLFAGIMGSNLLLADSLPNGIRIAHLVEVFLENLLFGSLVTIIFTPK